VLGAAGLARFDGPPGGAPFERGTAVHEACRLLDIGTLDESTLDERIAGYVQGWREFSGSAEIRWEMIEEPVVNKIYRYAGTPDRVGLAKCRDGQWRPIVVDIKTGSPAPWHALQTAGYALALGTFLVARRVSVYLDGMGRFRFREHTNTADGDTFLAAVTVARWRKAAGMKEAG
jgi:hypothetical protein